MVYIKKMVLHGFKSFAKKTEIVFDKGINAVIGPNGSGKSNLSDALCFVLGRLSIKSMRAAKAKNLIFMGSKYHKPAHEASVEMVFDNTDRAFSIDSDEVTLKRSVRANGQSIYKINDETKTRAEIIEMLAQAGIDPHGFNIILQGQIQAIVRMHSEDRRKIIEEVAGIAIYESRKEKSLHELEKTDEKLKEINSILRERTAYLKNLDRERAQALKFKELEKSVKRCKATIFHKKIEEKKKELKSINNSIEEKIREKEKVREKATKCQNDLDELSMKINEINKHIQQATGIEQEGLHTQIANLKAEIEGLRVRKENYEHRKEEIGRRIEEISRSIPEIQAEIVDLKKKSPMMAMKSQELKKKKDELALIEEERKKLLSSKSELNLLRERIRDRERQAARAVANSESLLKQLEDSSSHLSFRSEDECVKGIESLKSKLKEKRKEIDVLYQNELKFEKIISISESDIVKSKKIKADVEKIDVCPLCQSKMTGDHKSHVFKESDEIIERSMKELSGAKKEVASIGSRRNEMIKEIREIESHLSSAEIELMKQRNIKEKKELLKKAVEEEHTLKKEIIGLEESRKNLELKTTDLSRIEEKYDGKMLEIEEVSSRTEEDIDTTLLYKEREVENTQNVIKRSKKDLEELSLNISEISESFDEKNEMLEEKEEQERELNARFKRMFEERDKMQNKIQEENLNLSGMQNEMRQIEDQVNYLKIGNAKLDAEREALEMEIAEFAGIELLQSSMNVLEERLKASQEALMQIGSINMRALDVYESVKKDYDAVQEKVNTLDKEKMDILAIIEEIDRKKIRSFMKTFKAMNDLFSQNFSRLSSKGTAYLEIENKDDIFSAGVNIVVRLAKGKYFDVTSLSGGEQTLVALSLLFAIQEYKPYHFYIFDEIDAALDKRNSERLAGLLQQYMKAGQYIVITHNDAIILNTNILYGVSMHEGVSKILSLKVN